MAAKLLHSLADENPDLQQQIGCMTGIFQLFDRQHILTARRINPKRLPPSANRSLSGNSHFSGGRHEKDSMNIIQKETASDLSLNIGVNEKQRISTESSRASFSSSCSSSLSSLDCRGQADASFDHIIFPETPSREPFMNQTTISPHFGQQSLDLRDVVKDSMYREARSLSVKTTAKEEAAIHTMKRRDSPRPLQLSKSVDGSYGVGIERKHVDLKESLRVLSKLREAPWYHNESRELPRSSYEVNDGHRLLISKDAPRFSYDGREISRKSFESRDMIKGSAKLKELPRLSLDSREGSWCSYSSDSKSNHLSRGLGSGSSMSEEKFSSVPHSSATQRRPASVVAKLMGLESFPDSSMAVDTQSSLSETLSSQYDGQFPRSSKSGLIKPLKVFNSPRSSLKDPTSPRRKNPDLVMKPISSSRFPIEPAPWKQQDGNRSFQKPSFGAMKSPATTPESFPSVYSEIERRLKDLEFKQSGRDLRALKQILETMQANGLLETRKEEQALNVASQRDNGTNAMSSIQKSRSVKQQNPQGNNFPFSSRRRADSARTCESPIVIMKPAKFVEKTGFSASSVIPIGELSGAHKLNSGGNEDKKRLTTSSRIAKDQSPKNNHRDVTSSSNDKKASSSSNTMRSAQSQPRSQQFSRESSPSSAKSSGSVSPRMQQKKLEFERRSYPQNLPSESNKPRWKSGKQATDSGSPGGKQRPKSPNLKNCDKQLIQTINESKASSCQGDEVFKQSDSIIVSDSKMGMEVSSSLQSNETNNSKNPSVKDMKQAISGLMQMKSTPRLDEDESVAELATNSQEHSSPVSVLDGSVYRDDEPYPVKKISDAPKEDDDREYKGNDNEDRWNPADKLIYSTGSGEINRKKLQSIDHLVQKLRRVNSCHDESRNDYIASLCENTNPDQRYISEILVASGLLLSDLSSELLTFQLHSSGHPINPELFLVLEQTKASSLLPKDKCSSENVTYSKLKAEKFHRKLIFDAVNEILGVKLALAGSSPEPWVKPSRLTKKNLTAQKLLKELCFEIEKIQSKKPEYCSLEDEDGLRSILWEDVMHGSENWIDFHGEISGVVLDVERLIFKDLVDEVVIGEASHRLRIKPGRRRKLFGK